MSAQGLSAAQIEIYAMQLRRSAEFLRNCAQEKRRSQVATSDQMVLINRLGLSADELEAEAQRRLCEADGLGGQ